LYNTDKKFFRNTL